MLDILKNAFSKEIQLTHISSITSALAHIVNVINSDYVKDKDLKNAAIDSICQLLLEHKDPQSEGKVDGQAN